MKQHNTFNLMFVGYSCSQIRIEDVNLNLLSVYNARDL